MSANTAATIEKGSKVRVTFEAEYDQPTALGRYILKDANTKDASLLAPADAKVEVIAPPLPKEPPVGALVKAPWSDSIYKRSRYNGWYKITGTPETAATGGRLYYTWRTLNDEWGRGVLAPVVPDSTASAPDMAAKPYTIKDRPSGGLFDGPMSAQVVNSGMDVKFNLPCGDKVTISDHRARQLALAILKATGGL